MAQTVLIARSAKPPAPFSPNLVEFDISLRDVCEERNGGRREGAAVDLEPVARERRHQIERHRLQTAIAETRQDVEHTDPILAVRTHRAPAREVR